MFVLGMIHVFLTLWLFIWFKGSSRLGVLCTEDFGKPVRDPCCENVRVHYKQRTVYEILSLQHDDLRRGINCFQRVCPSQFPAFYRVMYVGGFPGTSVSFAVCSDGEHVNIDGQERSSTSTRGRVRRNILHRRSKVRSRNGDIMRRFFPKDNNRTRDFEDGEFVFRLVGNTNKSSRLFAKDMEIINTKPFKSGKQKLHGAHPFRQNRSHSFRRKGREADTSRTIFEIPEPRPSIVYTLTGVCFCLRVQSNPPSTNRDENIQPSNLRSGIMYRANAITTIKNSIQNNVNLSDTESQKDFKNGASAKLAISSKRVPHISKSNIKEPTKMQFDCVDGNCTFMELIKQRRRRSTFLDSFMKSVLESQKEARNQSMIPASSMSPPSALPVRDSTRLTTQSKTSSNYHNNLKVKNTHGTTVYTPIPKRSNDDNVSTRRSLKRQRNDTTLNFDDGDQENTARVSRGRILEDEASDDGNGNNDDPDDPEEFKDKLVVFASFSHDVHFIGSISMTVSVASSCRSNLPLSPETNSSSNGTQPLNPGSETKTTAGPMIASPKSSDKSNMNPTNTTHFQGNIPTSTSTTVSSKEGTIPKSLVEEVTGNSHQKVKDAGGQDDDPLDILLIWQVTAGVTFAILLVLILVLVTNFCRRRKRKRKERYSSLTPESTLQRLQNQQATNSSNTSEASLPTALPDNNLQLSARALTPAQDTITIPRTIQAISRNEPSQVINVGTVYPMHIRLRSLSAAAEAARLRGQEALRMLNNEKGNEEDTNTARSSLVSTRPIAPQRSGNNINRDVNLENNGYSRANHQKISSISTEENDQRSPRHLSPKIVVSEGPNTREFDLGQFAVYRNDIMLKLRRCGLRTGRRKRSPMTGSSRDYDNDENDGAESVYACYAGGETDI